MLSVEALCTPGGHHGGGGGGMQTKLPPSRKLVQTNFQLHTYINETEEKIENYELRKLRKKDSTVRGKKKKKKIYETRETKWDEKLLNSLTPCAVGR